MHRPFDESVGEGSNFPLTLKQHSHTALSVLNEYTTDRRCYLLCAYDAFSIRATCITFSSLSPSRRVKSACAIKRHGAGHQSLSPLCPIARWLMHCLLPHFVFPGARYVSRVITWTLLSPPLCLCHPVHSSGHLMTNTHFHPLKLWWTNCTCNFHTLSLSVALSLLVFAWVCPVTVSQWVNEWSCFHFRSVPDVAVALCSHQTSGRSLKCPHRLSK